jgi:SPP1 gp7 family putative phage head morphogenesis protein
MRLTAHHDHAPRHNVDRESGPTDTQGLQREYRVEVDRRFRKLRGVLRQTIDTHDALGLRNRTNAVARQHAAEDIEPRDRFPFRNRAGKELAFQNQLREWLDEGVLKVVGEDTIEAGEHWSGTYVRSSSKEGIRWANQQLRDRGVSLDDGASLDVIFDRPIHTDELERLYTRNFEALQDITEDLDQTLSRELTRGLLDGENPRTIADRLTQETRTIQRTRARTLARTETLRAHNAGAGRRYQEMGVQRVEILTHDPCPICQAIAADGPYPVREAHQLVPSRTHPRCVCSVAPVV